MSPLIDGCNFERSELDQHNVLDRLPLAWCCERNVVFGEFYRNLLHKRQGHSFWHHGCRPALVQSYLTFCVLDGVAVHLGVFDLSAHVVGHGGWKELVGGGDVVHARCFVVKVGPLSHLDPLPLIIGLVNQTFPRALIRSRDRFLKKPGHPVLWSSFCLAASSRLDRSSSKCTLCLPRSGRTKSITFMDLCSWCFSSCGSSPLVAASSAPISYLIRRIIDGSTRADNCF